MFVIRGIVVNLEIGSDGTDDHMYIGVVGTGGGREFPLNTVDFDDFKANSETTYVFGSVWEGEAISDPEVKNPDNARGANDPTRYQIDLDKVTQVYIRKGGTRKGNDDDTCFVLGLVVRLYATSSEGEMRRRRFLTPFNWARASRSTMTLSNRCGHQYWLIEEDEEPIFKKSSG